MPRTSQAGGFSGFEMVPVHFNDSEKVEYETWAKGRDKLEVGDITFIVEGGFKISLSYDKGTQIFTCSLTGKDTPQKKLAKKVFLLKHKDSVKLFGLALYFFTVILNSGEQLPKDMVDDLDW